MLKNQLFTANFVQTWHKLFCDLWSLADDILL